MAGFHLSKKISCLVLFLLTSSTIVAWKLTSPSTPEMLGDSTQDIIPENEAVPCPIPDELIDDIEKRVLPLVFEENKSGRLWGDVLKERTDRISISHLKKKIRDMLLVLYKLEAPNAWEYFGASGGGDLNRHTRCAMCDVVAMSHHHIAGGIDERIDTQDLEIPKLILNEDDMKLFQMLYQACRMTTINSHKDEGVVTQAAYLPTVEEENAINESLNIDPKRSHEVICRISDWPTPSEIKK